jgi:hypothetical protein
MKLKILELASFEIEDAKQYYNLQQKMNNTDKRIVD